MNTQIIATETTIPAWVLIVQNPWVYFLTFSLIGFLLGLLSEKIIVGIIKYFAKKTSWSIDDIIASSLKGRTILWLTILGIYYGAPVLPIRTAHINIINQILLVLAILTTASFVASMLRASIHTYFRKIFKVFASTSIVANLVLIIVYIIGILLSIQVVGIPIMPILTAFGIGGLAVALALQDTLSNIFSGVHIVLSRKVKPGDFIELDTGEKGYVTDITWRNTTVRSLSNNMIVVPNSKMASVVITNYYQPIRETSLKIDVGVSYDSDLDYVEKVTIGVAKQVVQEYKQAVNGFEPFIRYHTFDDSSINFKVIIRVVEYVDQYVIRHAFIKRLHKEYKLKGIVIPYPIRTVEMVSTDNKKSKSIS